MPALLPMLLTAGFVVLAADQVPDFNIDPTCRSATNASPGRTIEICRQDERDARAQLDKDWSRYAAKHRASCVRLSTLDGNPSYVEVLTCLEIAEEAAKAAIENKI
jgi:hypothetical protein